MFTFHQLLALSKGMEFPIGWEKDGFFRITDLLVLQHLLVSGTTGSGKSVFVDSLLLNLLAHNGPEKVEFILCGTKPSDFMQYTNIEHLFIPVCNDFNDISSALSIAFYEGQDRLKIFNKVGVKDIASFNDFVWERFGKELPHIVVIVDDMSLIVNHRSYAHTLEYIRGILSNGWAAGIHLISVTQTPAFKKMKNVLPLFPAKLAFRFSSKAELRLLTGEKFRNFKQILETHYIFVEEIAA